MIHEIYNLYKKNIPDIIRSEEIVKSILSDKDNYILEYKNGNKLVGVSVINENTIYLLCVDEPFQNRGIGAKLLTQSEEYIISKGFKEIIIGAGRDYIMPGIPMNNGVHNFFIKYGYVHSWGDCGCFDMGQILKDFNHTEHSIGDTINDITYRWATVNDLDSIIECVADAEEEFVPYYQDKSLFDTDTNTLILIAKKDNEVLGTLMVSIETEGKAMLDNNLYNIVSKTPTAVDIFETKSTINYQAVPKEVSDNNLNYIVSDMHTAVDIPETKSSTNYLTVPKGMGSVGCTTTRHSHRNKGIATTMVKLGTKYLKDIGLSQAYLSYTYTDILNIYAKAGYKVTMEYYMGKKYLSHIHESDN